MSIVNAERVFVGLDYHQNFVQVCVMSEQGRVLRNVKAENQWRKIVATVPAGATVHAAIEACCGAADLADELVEAGWSVSLAHAGFVSRMKQNPDKTDMTDAHLLSDLTRVGYLPKVWLAPQSLRELRRLVRYRQQKVNDRRDLKLRIRALLRDHRVANIDGNPWTKKWLKSLAACEQIGPESNWILQRHLTELARLDQEVREIDAHLEAHVASDAMVTKLREQKGVGLVTAATLRAEIGRFDRFRSGKQLAKFCGLSPCNASSGNKQADSGLIRTGNRQLRGVLIEAAHRLMRFDTRWHKLACELKNRGKHTCVVVAAVANRYMRWLYHHMQPEVLAA